MPNNNPASLASLRMPDYSGSWWSRNFSHTTSLRIGKWTPVGMYDIPAGSLVKLKPNIRFESLPMVSPLYNGFTMRTKYYFVPYRLYIPELRKNLQMPWGSIPNLKFPKMQFFGRYTDDGAVRGSVSLAGSLLERLGLAYGHTGINQSFNNRKIYDYRIDSSDGYVVFYSESPLIPLIAYIDCWMRGEYNPQDKNIPVDKDLIILNPNGAPYSRTYSRSFVSYDKLQDFVNSVSFGEFGDFDVSDYDPDSRLLTFASTDIANIVQRYPVTSELMINNTGGMSHFSVLKDSWSQLRNSVSGVGLLPVTYKGDYYTSWFSEEGITMLSDYVVRQGQTLLSLRKANQDFLVNMLSLISGNKYVDYLQYIMDTDLEINDHPIMIGYDEMDFGAVDFFSNAQTSDPGDVGNLGQLGASASKARQFDSSIELVKVKTKEPGLILCCTAIIPNVVYYQGLPRFLFYTDVADLWHPQYQKLGFMDTFRSEYYNMFATVNLSSLNGGVLVDDDGNEPFDQLITANRMAVSQVPLGYEHMTSYNTISGALRTDAYKTWTLRKDFYEIGGFERTGTIEGDVETRSNGFEPFHDAAIDLLKSTYVDGGAFNFMFANTSRAEMDNFVAKFSYDLSIYQPVVHTLISKHL